MKKIVLYLCVFMFLAINATFSQVAINMSGNNPDPSAMLDINAANKGLLIPRVSLSTLEDNQSPIPNPATGLMVFNLDGNSQPAGLYVWTGMSWTSYTTMEQVVNTVGAAAQIPSFGEMYEYHPLGSFTSLPIASSGSWVPWSSAVSGNVNNMTFSVSTFMITLAGNYHLAFNGSIQADKAGHVVDAAVFVNGVRQDNLSNRQWFKEHSKPYMISLSGILYLSANDTVNVRFTMDDDGVLRIETANLSLNKID